VERRRCLIKYINIRGQPAASLRCRRGGAAVISGRMNVTLAKSLICANFFKIEVAFRAPLISTFTNALRAGNRARSAAPSTLLFWHHSPHYGNSAQNDITRRSPKAEKSYFPGLPSARCNPQMRNSRCVSVCGASF
jgi:hypothetical protein